MGIANDIANKAEIKVSKNLLGGYKSESVEELKESVKSLKSALKTKENIISNEKENKATIIKTLERYQENNAVLKNNLEKVIGDENLRETEFLKRYEKLKKEIDGQFSTILNRNRNLKLLDSFEKIVEYLGKGLQKISNELKITKPYFEKLNKDTDFQMNLYNKIEKKVNVSQEVSQEQTRRKGRSL